MIGATAVSPKRSPTPSSMQPRWTKRAARTAKLPQPAKQIDLETNQLSCQFGLRHGCGYALANAGHDTRALQTWLGHKNIQHTVRYTELSPHRLKDFWR